MACKKSLRNEIGIDFNLQAKLWFNKKYNDKLKFNKDGQPSYGKYPDWRFIKNYELDGYKVVETPLNEKYKKIFYKNAEEKHYLFNNKVVTTLNKFLIWGKNGKFKEVIMTIVGDKKYLSLNRDLSTISPNNIPKNFSGMIFYKTYEGLFLKGWFYDNGKATNKIKWYTKKEIASRTTDGGDPCILCHPETTFNSTENGCQRTTNYYSNITDQVVAGPYVEEVDPINCADNSGGDGPPTDEEPVDDEPGDDWGDGGFGDDGSGAVLCDMYPNPFCECADGAYFNCSIDDGDNGEQYYQDACNYSSFSDGLFYEYTNCVISNAYFYVLNRGRKFNPRKLNNCFNKNESATLTICVEQPEAGNRDAKWSTSRSAGHTFVKIQQGNSIVYFGFYPVNNEMNATCQPQPSSLHYNENSDYNVSISKEITSVQLTSIINYSINYPQTFNLCVTNCTDFGIKIGNLAGMNLPITTGNYEITGFVFGSGRNPADLGEDIRAMTPVNGVTIDKTMSYKKSTTSTCQ